VPLAQDGTSCCILLLLSLFLKDGTGHITSHHTDSTARLVSLLIAIHLALCMID
jgi:hypothetical protein